MQLEVCYPVLFAWVHYFRCWWWPKHLTFMCWKPLNCRLNCNNCYSPQLREPVAMPFDLIWVYPGWNESIDANIFLNDLFVITGLNLNNCYSLNILSGKYMGYLSIFSWILSVLVNHILNLNSPKFFMKDINVMRNGKFHLFDQLARSFMLFYFQKASKMQTWF